jgi:tellurite resistance protein
VLLATLVAVLLRPAQSVAERVAAGLMPDVRPDDAYFEKRRLAIFQAALESATIDGEISSDERELLRRVQLELGLEDELAERLEREALAIRGLDGSSA